MLCWELWHFSAGVDSFDMGEFGLGGGCILQGSVLVRGWRASSSLLWV